MDLVTSHLVALQKGSLRHRKFVISGLPQDAHRLVPQSLFAVEPAALLPHPPNTTSVPTTIVKRVVGAWCAAECVGLVLRTCLSQYQTLSGHKFPSAAVVPGSSSPALRCAGGSWCARSVYFLRMLPMLHRPGKLTYKHITGRGIWGGRFMPAIPGEHTPI